MKYDAPVRRTSTRRFAADAAGFSAVEPPRRGRRGASRAGEMPGLGSGAEARRGGAGSLLLHPGGQFERREPHRVSR